MSSRRRDRSISVDRLPWRPVDRAPCDPACKGKKGIYLGPHNRCGHPTPLPIGYRRCVGDPGCPIRLNDRSPFLQCHEHRRLDLMPHDPHRGLRELMGA